jgi:hypothetical protein
MGKAPTAGGVVQILCKYISNGKDKKIGHPYQIQYAGLKKSSMHLLDESKKLTQLVAESKMYSRTNNLD